MGVFGGLVMVCRYSGDHYHEFWSIICGIMEIRSMIYRIIQYMLPELFHENKAFRGGLPRVTRFQILMVLATMWAFIFALITQSFISIGVNVTTSVIAHALVIGGIIFTKKNLNINYKFDSYHSVGRQRGYTWARDKQGNPYKIALDPNDPGGEHE
jgi:hypothetical protein